MKTLQVNFKKYLFPCVAMILYVGMVTFSFKYEMSPYLWFDDAGQFWISQGLNHDSAPLSPTGGLMDVITNNAGYNLDPGGFGIILHYWSMISTNYIWLRSLSFLFFILSTLILGYLGYEWTKNINIGIWASFVLFFISMIYYNGFNVRAYSMEVLGCLISVLAIHRFQKGLSYKKLIGWSILIAIFMTSRYSFIVVAFVTSLYVLYLIYQSNNTNKTKLLMAVVYALPLFAILAFIYFAALRYQNPKLETLGYLPYISTNWKVIFHIASLRHLFYIFVILWITFVFRKSEKLKPYKGLIFITISANVLFFIFSCLGMHPWDGGCDRCISMITLVIISITALWCELLKLVDDKFNIQYILLAFICLQLARYKTDIKSPWWFNNSEYILTDWAKLDLTEKRIYVDRWQSPCLRYLIEHGSLQGVPNYPQNFTFAAYRKHGFGHEENAFKDRKEWYEKTQPELNDLYDKYDVLVVPELYGNKPDNCDKWKRLNDQNDIIWIKKE